ncbi:hypothetical protein DS893_01200 [Vibrionales bacterium C3R12]|nr:hypothetical protein DS893_01200 [Vibrionales bacterium C3R12]
MKKNGILQVNSIQWLDGITYLNITITSSGNFWYRDSYKCTQRGFFTCKSGYNVDYQFKLRDSSGKEYVIKHVDGYPRRYTEKNDEGKIVKRRRELVELNAGTYDLVFTDVPKQNIKDLDLYEDFCGNTDGQWSVCDIETQYFDEEQAEQQAILDYLAQYNIATLSVDTLKELHGMYRKYDRVTVLLENTILERILQTNSIEKLHQYNLQFKSNHEMISTSTEKIFSLIKTKDSVAGYEWFISQYSSSKWAIEALKRTHEIMYSNAAQLNTITSYNTFIINYPTASQVKLALSKSMSIEKVIYTDFGLLSFFNIDKEKEKKARKLLIKAKQIERYPVDNKLSNENKVGYLLVADRMYKLLQQEFDEADATLRHLESKEFKDFVKDLNSSLDRIQSTLDKIDNNSRRTASYVQESIAVSKKGFSDASADRGMSEYYLKKHREWEKLMHNKDHGYQ